MAIDTRPLLDRVNQLTTQVSESITQYQTAKDTLGRSLNNNSTAEVQAAAQAAVDQAKSNLDSIKSGLTSANADLQTAQNQNAITNPSPSDAEALARQTNATIVGDTSLGSLVSTAKSVLSNPAAAITGAVTGLLSFGKRSVPGVPAGAQPLPPQPVQATIKNAAGAAIAQDLRVQIRVPPKYFTRYTSGLGSELQTLGAILFPYTPQISYEHKADYNSQTPTHSNFAVYFYKNSSVSPITVTGKWTVQNEKDAGIYLATIHLLRALTKMRSGGDTGDVDSGAPPPVCRFDAYGDFMMDNVPVVINSFRIDLPEGVDYYRLGKISGSTANTIYNQAAVPIVSTLAITLIPVYSRQEMQKFSVGNFSTGWLGDSNSRKSGYL